MRGPMLVAVGTVLAGGAAAWAQSAGVPADGAAVNVDTGALPTLLELFYSSPIINGIIVALSILALMLFLFFLMTINTRGMVPADFVDEVTKLVLRGKLEAASDLCRTNRRTFIATIVQRFVDNPAKGHSVIMDMIDTEGRRRADIVWNRISYLADIANVAPMLGLLGTVIGMMRAFFTARYQALNASADVLTQGIAQAMTTTMFGLIVAILALVFYSIVKARATRALAEAEAAVHSIADHLKREGE